MIFAKILQGFHLVAIHCTEKFRMYPVKPIYEAVGGNSKGKTETFGMDSGRTFNNVPSHSIKMMLMLFNNSHFLTKGAERRGAEGLWWWLKQEAWNMEYGTWNTEHGTAVRTHRQGSNGTFKNETQRNALHPQKNFWKALKKCERKIGIFNAQYKVDWKAYKTTFQNNCLFLFLVCCVFVGFLLLCSFLWNKKKTGGALHRPAMFIVRGGCILRLHLKRFAFLLWILAVLEFLANFDQFGPIWVNFMVILKDFHTKC